MTTYLTGTPDEIHAGAVSFHVRFGPTWYGILMDSPAKIPQMIMFNDCYNMHAPVVFRLSGSTVPSNVTVTGSSTVPEAVDINRGFTPPVADVAAA